jgi:hypothetical protein
LVKADLGQELEIVKENRSEHSTGDERDTGLDGEEKLREVEEQRRRGEKLNALAEKIKNTPKKGEADINKYAH